MPGLRDLARSHAIASSLVHVYRTIDRAFIAPLFARRQHRSQKLLHGGRLCGQFIVVLPLQSFAARRYPYELKSRFVKRTSPAARIRA